MIEARNAEMSISSQNAFSKTLAVLMPPESQKICLDCLEPIPAKARKCLKCGSFQDWRRFTGQSATTLSLLIALITVSTFAYNTWRG